MSNRGHLIKSGIIYSHLEKMPCDQVELVPHRRSVVRTRDGPVPNVIRGKSLLAEEMLERSYRFFCELPRHRDWRGLPKLTFFRKDWLQPLSRTSAQLYSQRLAQMLEKGIHGDPDERPMLRF